MPGIAGIIRKQPREAIGNDLGRMVESMRHETYYVGDRYVNVDAGLYLGWVSHPSSLGACMPLRSKDGKRMLVLVGEHFTHRGWQSSDNGFYSPESSAQQILHLYEELGDDFLSRINGWFCGIAIDLHSGTAILFNDRYAMSRIYFHQGEDEFIFASEAKALLRIRPELRSIDPEGLGQYLRFNCVMGNKSLFKDVFLLPAASAWTFSGGSAPQKRSYFNFSNWEEQPTLTPDEFYQQFESTVSRVFPSYMQGSQPVAFSLTAGLDTRAILACTRDQKRPFPCYTFGGMWGETYDIQTARRLAAICGQPFEVVKINEQFLREFPEYASKSVYISDGTHDALGAHDVYFNEAGHRIAPIRLTGKFGSEVVRTRRLIPHESFPKDLLQPSFAPYVAEARPFEQITNIKHPLTSVVTEEIPWYELGRVSVEQSKVILRTPYMDNDLVRLMYQAPAAVRASRDLQARYVIASFSKLASVKTNMGRITYGNRFISRGVYLPLWALFKVEYFYLYAAPHWFTRIDTMLSPLKPERILSGRQKFEGYRIWMRTHLADFIRSTLLSPGAKCVEFFDRSSVERVVTGHLAGTHNYLLEINKMLTLELTYSTLFKS